MKKNSNRQHFTQLAIAQGKLEQGGLAEGNESAKKQNERLQQITKNNRYDADDWLSLNVSKKSLQLHLMGAQLATTNLLLRVGDIKATNYKNQWVQRLHNSRLTCLPTWREWQAVVSYPLVIDAYYSVPHGAQMDRDGLVGALKYPIDALHKTGFIKDDKPEYVCQILPFSKTGSTPALHLQLRPSPSPYGYLDPALVDEIYL